VTKKGIGTGFVSWLSVGLYVSRSVCPVHRWKLLIWSGCHLGWWGK